ncbi:Hpt domain-containing protein [Candidatus Pelagadaptatus aseana]|uniref:Hpt domain-containing protein n=1 Tax=Candidatus Pelagadaptatus aseana TaxID=3120508 RepID=UPI003C6F0EEB
MFGDDADLRNAILEEFANSATPYMTELDAAIARKSAEGVKSLAHKLKSSSRTVGAQALGDLCEALENSAPNADWHGINTQELALKSELERVLDYIRSLC